ncbi:methyltransferase domain-containing protein [Klugiella xanthotipulae]|uniref:Methyltransferase family protein n=1 Tax=Klugiella xanthotipulae TaxID=244735 RepID=A0A543I5N1_9MICO|nr:class I SAM-dependent methyltransferase [Klugiella xanthotipulae]TQM65916.1 methyltransferase family protein [Klugiella xanthotipulae]
MSGVRVDGSAGDVDYGEIGGGYRAYRQPEPAIQRAISEALSGSRTVLNVGAGAGSYEPVEREVTPVEPSETMRAQRPPHLMAAINAYVEDLPFADNEFDAAMTTFSVHQWGDLEAGLAELRRVTRGPVVILTCDPDLLGRFWLNDYAPEVIEAEASRYPSPRRVAELLGGDTSIRPVPIPLHCVDRFGEAYYGRPELLLDPGARRANSAWSFVGPQVHERFERTLRVDLDSGTWDERYGWLRRQAFFDGSLVLITALPGE